jgi:hypothetical protein
MQEVCRPEVVHHLLDLNSPKHRQEQLASLAPPGVAAAAEGQDSGSGCAADILLELLICGCDAALTILLCKE